MEPVRIDGYTLTPDDVEKVAWNHAPVELAPEARERVQAARRYVEKVAAGDRPVYGVNTGFGALAEVKVAPEDMEQLQRNLIVSHAAGSGAPLSEPEVRAIMLLRANVIAKGFSGVRLETLELLIRMINDEIHPIIPEKGSVGASGDLAPLAHLALAMIGEGDVEYRGTRISAAEALERSGLQPVRLGAKEGLGLINGTQAMAALGCLTLVEAERLARLADIAGASSLEGLMGTPRAFDPKIQEVRNHPGQIKSAQNLRTVLADSEIVASHVNCQKVQDPYSLRCMPQVHGAVRNTLEHAREVITREINAATDNPLVFTEADEIISGGNFHGEPIALVLDYMGYSIGELANISERRIEQMVNPSLSGLPAFLTPQSGLNSGYMIAHVTAAALVNEDKALSWPASCDSLPTSANREDHVSMGMTSARKARQILSNVRTVLAIEFLCAAQAIDFRAPLTPGRGVEAAHKTVRAVVPHLEEDRILHDDLMKVEGLIVEGRILKAVEEAVGELA